MRDDPTATPETEALPATPPPAAPPEDWETRFKYLLADFENFRRRSEKERESVTRQSRAALLRELLPILEAFRAARLATERLPKSDPVRTGLDLLDREWSTFLKHEGVEPVARVGETFRSDETEAVGETAPRDGVPDGAIAEIVQQGYRFFGGLLRPAKVIVARHLAGAPPADRPEAASETTGEKVP